jgi:hypothetical protein
MVMAKMSEGGFAFCGAVLGGILALVGAFGAIWVQGILERRTARAQAEQDSLVEILAAGQSHVALLGRTRIIIGHRSATAQQGLTELGMAHAALLERIYIAHARLRTLDVADAKQTAADAVVADVLLHTTSPPDLDNIKERIAEALGDVNALIRAVDPV